MRLKNVNAVFTYKTEKKLCVNMIKLRMFMYEQSKLFIQKNNISSKKMIFKNFFQNFIVCY